MEADSPSIAPTNSKKRKAEEADATWGGLFPEVQGEKAKKQRRVHTHGVDDVDDGVFRCWRCNWEIEDGQCEHWCASLSSLICAAADVWAQR